MPLKKLEEDFLKEIDYVKQIKNYSEEIEKDLSLVRHELETTLYNQQLLVNYIQLVFKDKCWLEKNKRFIELKNEIFKALNNIKGLTEKNREKINKIKNYTDKTLSLIKSFYDKTTKDSLTWLRNEKFINNLIDVLWGDKRLFHLVYLDLNNLKLINDMYWHNAGDIAIKEFANLLKIIFWEWKNFISRLHWDEFNIVSLDSEEELKRKLRKLDKWLENKNIVISHNNKDHKINIETAYWYECSKNVDTIAQLIRNADKEMYKNKLAKKNKS